MLLAQFDTSAHPRVRAQNVAAHIFRIAEAAQGRGFELGRPSLAGQIQTPTVLAQATIHVATWEAQIATQVVDARPLRQQLAKFCSNPLGSLEIVQRARQIIGHSLDRRQANPSATPLDITDSRRHHILVGAPCVYHGTKIMQNVALATEQRATVLDVAGKNDTPLD